MSKASEITACKGQVSWSSKDEQWVIEVYRADGGMIRTEDVFHGVVLAEHLRRADIKDALASLNKKHYRCAVWREQTGDLAKHGDKLLKVLKKHYSKFQGRPIDWILDK